MSLQLCESEALASKTRLREVPVLLGCWLLLYKFAASALPPLQVSDAVLEALRLVRHYNARGLHFCGRKSAMLNGAGLMFYTALSLPRCSSSPR